MDIPRIESTDIENWFDNLSWESAKAWVNEHPYQFMGICMGFFFLLMILNTFH